MGRILVKHRCGLVSDYSSVGDMIAELHQMYPRCEIDGARALVWASDDGVPVAEISYGGTR